MWKEGRVMNEQLKSKGSSLIVFLLCFYIAIIMYIFLGILHIDVLQNFVAGIIFEIIGFVLLAVIILNKFILKPIKTGYYIPIVVITIIYTIFLNLLNILAISIMESSVFILLHLILLFAYCLLSVPMYIMGKR